MTGAVDLPGKVEQRCRGSVCSRLPELDLDARPPSIGQLKDDVDLGARLRVSLREWLVSNKLIGRIRSLPMRPAPECMRASSRGREDPVRMHNPLPSWSSTARRTRFHSSGVSCHSSNTIGVGMVNS